MSRKLSISDINSMNKEQLKKCLKDLIKDLDAEKNIAAPNPRIDEDRATVSNLLSSILAEVQQLRTERADLKKEIDQLKSDNVSLIEAVNQHQRFLESNDSEKRACNLIITGVPETPFTDPDSPADSPVPVNTDSEKVDIILRKIGHKADVKVKDVVRLGKQRKNGKQRKSALDDTKKLKDAGKIFKKIYVNKDIHPVVRKELNRIRKAEGEEKQKPENRGRVVKYDYATRCLTVDGTVIDKFKPAFSRQCEITD